MAKELLKISCSGVEMFCNCRKAFYLKYKRNLVPVVESSSLFFGRAWHELLKEYYTSQDVISEIFYNELTKDKTDKMKLKAMLRGYHNLYFHSGRLCDKDFNKIIAVELPFEIYIRPPYKGRAARGVRFRGFIDAVVERDDGLWIMEHKTTSQLSGNYIDDLWHKMQGMQYAYAYQEATGEKIQGIMYNIVQKTRIQQKAGETAEEFNTRYVEACAKNKSGKSSATRDMPETDEEYQNRLYEQYKNDYMFKRIEILCDARRLREVQTELWEINKAMRTKNFYKNRAQCFVFSECQYFRICNSGDNEVLIANHYKQREER